uniref:Uncharacterized protein n=1 Tax=Leptobrachium leishanense TaxID=445787 RepID=A0A8C5MK19_9ANUR
MDSRPRKNSLTSDFQAKPYYQSLLSPEADKGILQDGVINVVTYLQNEFAAGKIKGDVLIDISHGLCFFTLFAVCEHFKEITVLACNDAWITEIEKWMQNDSDAFDWSHVLMILKGLEGNSGDLREKEEHSRKIINRILKCDLAKKNPTDPISIEKADCVLSAWLLEVLCNDEDEYRYNLGKISSLLKPGGRLIMAADINTSFVKLGEHIFHVFKYNEDFLKKTLEDLNFKIETYKPHERTTYADIIDHEKLVLLTAIKLH